MAEEGEDVKPKLNLTIQCEDQSITVKVKANTKFNKIFEAASNKFGKSLASLKFTYEGVRVLADETPHERDMEDGDVIDAHIEQIGGWKL
ncbi:ubiquitin-related domain-containing protein [Pterulicium gracile]|uniref:Ubiquitin-related domain-containing protein n=1 Tax=Pterulicium gracile TaxID=1884261 RepID=A0A5C3Q7H9_9AGAR|nr:ubiquitin-related domain-containing protein [Pterula gracilis]